VFRAVSIVKVHTIRFVGIYPLCLWAVQTGGVTQGGDFQNLVDDVAHEFQAEISMNCSFEQGENVASSPNG